MWSTLKHLSLTIPPIRRLVTTRDRLAREHSLLLQEKEQLREERDQLLKERLAAIPTELDKQPTVATAKTDTPNSTAPIHRRFLSDNPTNYEAYIRAAQDYVAKVGGDDHPWLYRKPFDNTPGNSLYYTHLYNVLNLLKAMQIPHGGTILEVGSGAGWLTEILFSLGFEVIALEPCESMIRAARNRLAACITHYRIQNPPRFTFLHESLEECSLPSESVDAIIFNEALHHVVDEERGLARCFDVLRRGGLLGVTSESEWVPGNLVVEESWRVEMAQWGTLENPYTFQYLQYLLHKQGFRDIVRYHGINGFFPVHVEGQTIKQAAQLPAEGNNHLTARKPLSNDPTTADLDVVGHAEVSVLEASWDRSLSKAKLKVKLLNNGKATWLHGPLPADGLVALGLCRKDSEDGILREATHRVRLPRSVLPGEELIMDAEFRLPGDARSTWYVDLICEGGYWFHTYGTYPAEVRLP